MEVGEFKKWRDTERPYVMAGRNNERQSLCAATRDVLPRETRVGILIPAQNS